jgi:hypothetical protein
LDVHRAVLVDGGPDGNQDQAVERLTAMRRLLALVLVPMLALVACGDDEVSVGTDGTTTSSTEALPPIPAEGAPEQDRLDAARARWEAAGIDSYTWRYERHCLCPPLEVEIVVVDGVATAHELVPATDGAPGPVDQELEILTMDDLLDAVQDAIDTAASLTVGYDPGTGQVRTLDVDQIENAVDDEYGYAVTAFEATGSSTPTTQAERIDPATLTEAWGCGYGFHMSDEAQTVAVQLDFSAAGDGPAAVTELPSPDWEAVVVTGERLFANWCNDVIDMTRPQPQIDETWDVVEGTITFDGAPPALQPPADQPVTARVTGLVAERPDGTRVAIGDLTVTNDTWGFLAG